MPALNPDWSSMRLVALAPHGAVFSGAHGDAPATFVRLLDDAVPAVEDTVRRVALLEARASRRVLAAALDASPPWLAVEQPQSALLNEPPQALAAALELIADLTDAIEQAHGCGLVHGQLSPESVGLLDGHASVSFLPDDVTPDPAVVPDPREDLFGLGAVMAHLLEPLEPEPRRDGWLTWARRLMDADPAGRPSLRELCAAMKLEPRQTDPNARVGRFALGAVISQGPLGAVHDAVDRATNAAVSVTVCPVASEDARARQADLGVRLAALRHPSLPAVLEVGEEGSVVFWVTQPVSGGQRPATDAELAGLGAALASALAVLHEAGLAHGDVSEAWLAVEDGRPQLFGVGCCVGAPRDDVKALSALLHRLAGGRTLSAPLADALASTLEAAALAQALHTVAGHRSTSPGEHPPAPQAGATLQTFTLECELRAPPTALWAHVANTERVNKASGVAAASRAVEPRPDSEPLIRGRANQAGFTLEWVEHPFEWVAGRRFGVLREYASGPLQWLRSVVELHPRPEGGTRLVQTLEAQPRSLLMVPIVAAEVGLRTRAALKRVYARIDAHLVDAAASDPFEDVETLSRAQEKELAQKLEALKSRGADEGAVNALAAALRTFSAQDLARVQPLALAHRFGVGDDPMVTACLHAAAIGLLVPSWDLLCPSCRIASGQAATLADLRELSHCEACALDFASDVSGSIELVFRPTPTVREVDLQSYCLSSPAHSPHVALQQTLSSGERLTVSLELAPGRWSITRRGAPEVILDVENDARRASAAELSLQHPARWLGLAAGTQRLVLHNDTGSSVRVRIEAQARRENVLTAAVVLGHPLFRAAFPSSNLGDGVRVGASALPLLALDSEAPETLEPLVTDAVRAGGVRCRHKPALIAFDTPEHAFAAALEAALHGARASAEVCEATLCSSDGGLDAAGPGVDALVGTLEDAAAGQIILGAAMTSMTDVAELTSQLVADGAVQAGGTARGANVRLQVSIRGRPSPVE